MDRMAGALVLCCALAVGAGLWTIGGPFQARIERRDSQRLDDIRWIARHAACLREHGHAPDGNDPRCAEPERRADPYSGKPYAVDASMDGMIRVCAEFETNAHRSSRFRIGDFDPNSGCVTQRIDPEAIRPGSITD